MVAESAITASFLCWFFIYDDSLGVALFFMAQ